MNFQEYEPLRTSDSSNLSNKLDDSIEKLDTIDDEFSSFKSYSTKEIANRVVTFNQISLSNNIEQAVAYFYANKDVYEMNDADKVGICLMQKQPFVTKLISECEAFDIDYDNNIITKKVVFNLKDISNAIVNVRYYYQFVYQNELGDILGLSIPFRFNQEATSSLEMPLRVSTPSSSNESISEMPRANEDGFVLIQSPEVFLKNRCEDLAMSNRFLQHLIHKMETDLSEKNKEISQLRNEMYHCKEKIDTFDKQNDTLKEKVKTFEMSIHKYTQELMVAKEMANKEAETRAKLEETIKTEANVQEKAMKDIDQLNLDLTELRKILADKQEEINRIQNLNAEYVVKNESFEQKYNLARSQIESLQSNLAIVVNERNRMADMITNSEDKKTIGELSSRIVELETCKDRQSEEIRKLEGELHTTLTNLKNMSSKYEIERETVAAAQKALMENDKSKLELAELKVRFAAAREEYAKIFKKYQAFNMKQQKPSTSSTSSQVDDLSNEKNQSQEIEAELLRLRDSMNINESWKSLKPIVHKSKMEHQQQPANEGCLIEIEIDEKNDQLKYSESSSSVQEPPPSSSPTSPPQEQNTIPKELFFTPSVKEKKMISLPCIMCDKMIACEQYADDSPRQLYEMVAHLESVHMQQMCPICSTMFDTRLPIFSIYFNKHVQEHFDNDVRYPKMN